MQQRSFAMARPIPAQRHRTLAAKNLCNDLEASGATADLIFKRV
jgi:hypothetical protein